MKGRTTLKELSELLNLSVSTVSKSLNNSPEISENTKQRVQDAAMLNHYIPNVSARNLKTQKTRSIGIIIPSICSPFFSEVVHGIEAEARKRNYKVIICISNESIQEERTCVTQLIQSQVDGIIISPSRETQASKETDHLEELSSYNIPMVIFDRLIASLKCDKISINDQLHAELAVNEMFQTGCRKIAFISNSNNTSIHKEREYGYFQAMKSLDLKSFTLKFENNFPGEHLIKKFQNGKLDGILACTESVALRSMKYLLQNGIQIPDDVAVIGFASNSMSKHFVPSLSAIDQRASQQGQLAMETLSDRIAGKLPSEMLVYTLDAQIIHRQSTRKVKEQIA